MSRFSANAAYFWFFEFPKHGNSAECNFWATALQIEEQMDKLVIEADETCAEVLKILQERKE